MGPCCRRRAWRSMVDITAEGARPAVPLSTSRPARPWVRFGDAAASAQGRHPAPRGRARGALGRAARHDPCGGGPGLRFGVGRRTPALSLVRSAGSRPVGGLDVAGRDRGLDVADRARAARRVHELPQPGAARQAGRHDRRAERRPLRAGSRSGLERDGVPRLWLPVRPSHRSVRGGVHDHPRPPARRGGRLRRALVPGPRLRAAAARPATGRAAAHDRIEGPADAPRDDGPCRRLERLVRRHRQRGVGRGTAARARRRRLSRGRA